MTKHIKHIPTEQEWKYAKKDLREIKRCVLKDREFVISTSNEVIEIIDDLMANPNKKSARKLLTRLNWLDLCQDLGEFVLYQFEKLEDVEKK